MAGTVSAMTAGAVGLELVARRGRAAAAAATSATVPANPTSSSTAPGISASQGTLILCTMYGGNDGLNTLVPYADPAYQSGRGSLAFQAGEVIALDSSFGLHPSLTGFKSLWDAGQLAIVRGVGYPNPVFSHFRSMDIWQSAVPDSDVQSGWIGRWMDATGSDPLRSISVGDLLPKVMTGDRSLGAAVPTSPMVLPGTSAGQKDFSLLNTPTSAQAPVLAAIAQSGADMLRVQKTVTAALASPSSGQNGAAPGSSPSSSPGSSGSSGGSNTGAATAGGDVGVQLDTVARLIAAGVPTKVFGVSQQSYDTHADEKATQARLLGELDTAVTNFVRQMSQDPQGQHSVVLMYSEFGRRVQANASGGTDHGSASVLFVAGPRVQGGYYGDQPSLANLDDGNLVFTTDFRSVYATLLDKVIGEDPKVALDGSFPTLAFL